MEESKKKAKRTGKPTNGKSDQTRVEEDAEMDAEVDGTPRETTKRAGEGDEEEMDNTNDHDDDILPDSASAYENITGIWGARMSPQDSSIEIAVEWYHPNHFLLLLYLSFISFFVTHSPSPLPSPSPSPSPRSLLPSPHLTNFFSYSLLSFQ